MAGGSLKYYIDLIAVAILVGLCILFVLVEPFNETPLRIPFSLIILLFLPGYALIAAMFPKMGEISGIERFTLSIGLSIAIMVFDGFAISVTPYLFRPTPLILTLSVITLLLLLVTVITRTLTLEDKRYFVDYQGFIESLRADDEKMTDIERMLFIALIGSIIIASSMLIYAKLTFEDEEFSALYILGPDGKAEGYQKNFYIGEPGTITVGAENYEHAATDYMLQVKLGTGVLETRKITLAHKEKWLEDITFVPDRTGDRLKLEFVLYKDGKSYRSVHLWVNSSINYDDTSSLLNYLIVPPDISNGGMEENSSWTFRSNRNFTGSYSNVSHSSNHSYELVSAKPDEGWYGEISQEIVSPKPGLAVLRFAVRDSILKNTTGYMLQVLLNDAIVWEDSAAKDMGWQRIRFPVMLQNASRLTMRVYSERSNPNISVWWDDVEFETLTTTDVAYYEPSIIFGTSTDVSVVIENYEPAYTNYTLALKLGGELVAERDACIKSCAKSMWNLTFTPRMIGSHLPLEFLLYKDGAVYRYDVKTVSSSVDYSNIDFVMDYSITPPRIRNSDMEYNKHWEYTGEGNFTGNYTNTTSTLGHRSYEITTLENSSTMPGDFGAISQEIVSRGGIVLLTFDVRDSQTSDTEGRHKKQVLLSGIPIWEDDASGDEGWQRVEVPVMLATNNTLTLRVYGEAGGTDFQVWWDNVEFKKFEGEVESETEIVRSVRSVHLGNIPMSIRAGSMMTLISSNCDQLDSGEKLVLYFSEDGVVEPENATYTSSIRYGEIRYHGKQHRCPKSKPDILLPILVDDRSRTMRINETWDIGGGYNLSLRDVDTVQETVLLELNRNHEAVDSHALSENGTFEYRADLSEVGDDVLLFRCHIEEILLDQSAEIDDLYLYSDTPVHVNIGDRYGEFEVDLIDSSGIVFKNADSIVFSGTCSILNETISFEVSDNRRYAYLYTTKTGSDTYRLEGTPSSYRAEAGLWMNLTGYNHPAFCYDLETGVSYEELKVHFSDDRFIAEGDATYMVNVVADETGFLGQRHRSFNSESADTLSRILVNESDEDVVQLNIDDVYALREGYLLTLRDVFITGGTAWLELEHEGDVTESDVCMEGEVFEYSVSVTGRDVPVFECTIETIFEDEERGFVLLKSIKQYSDEVKNINSGDRYGKFKVSEITANRIVMKNTESITINDETSILEGWLKFEIDGNYVTPYVQQQVGGRI
jgi:S-layer protein (TIGR01567 family)